MGVRYSDKAGQRKSAHQTVGDERRPPGPGSPVATTRAENAVHEHNPSVAKLSAKTLIGPTRHWGENGASSKPET